MARSSGRVPSLAALAVCCYVVGLPSAFEPDVALIALALVGSFAAIRGRLHDHALATPLGLGVAAFVAMTLLSTVFSYDPWRSVRLSTPLLPSMLIFVLVAGYFEGDDDLRLVYGVYSAVALWLAGTILVAAASHGHRDPTATLAALASPLLVVPNDGALLAVVAPFSMAVLVADARRVWRVTAAASLLASVAAIAVLESRIATLALFAGLACWGASSGRFRPSSWLPVLVGVALLADGLRGFPLLAKFATTLQWNTRIALWLSALAMAADAPIVGHGPRSFGPLYGDYLASLTLPPWLPVDDRVAPWPHNLFLEALAEGGIVGLVALAGLVGGTVLLGSRVVRGADGSAGELAAGAFAASVAFAVAAFCELTFLRHWVVVVLLTIVGAVTYTGRGYFCSTR